MALWDGWDTKVGDFFNPSTHKYDKAAREALEKASAEWDDLDVPELQDISYDPYKFLGDLQVEGLAAPATVHAREISAEPDVNWQGAQQTTLGPSAMENVSSDPRLREAQMAALGSLAEIADNGGLTLADRANLEKIRGQTATADRGRREAILQNMKSRGMGGSGMELLAQLDSSQAAGDQEAQASLDIAGQAQQRALEAMMQRGNMAGSIRGQDFDQDARIAAARDAANQFNAAAANDFARFNAQGAYNAAAGNRDARLGVQQFNAGQVNDMSRFNSGQNTQVGMHNVGARNDAKTASWKAAQDIANADTDLKNKAKQYNTVEKPQAQYDMNAKKTAGKAGTFGAQSQYWGGAADRKAGQFGQIFSGLTSLAGAAAKKGS